MPLPPMPAFPVLSCPASSRRERTLGGVFAVLVLVAMVCPALAGPEPVSAFADARSWHQLPNAMDVLSNLAFLAVGLLGLWRLRQLHRPDRLDGPEPCLGHNLACAGLFFAGLVTTTVGSVLYHLQPDVLRLAGDRAGMTLAFAGLIGFSVCERVSQRTGWAAAWLTLAGGLLAVAVWLATGNVVPWATLQFGGMALVLVLALTKPLPEGAGAVGLKLGWIIFWYALAKLFELSDHAIYEITQHLVSGHSLKHLTAALAGLPVLQALHVLRRQSLRHNPGAAAFTA